MTPRQKTYYAVVPLALAGVLVLGACGKSHETRQASDAVASAQAEMAKRASESASASPSASASASSHSGGPHRSEAPTAAPVHESTAAHTAHEATNGGNGGEY